MSIFGDTDQQQANELAQGELAQSKPTGFMENAAAAWKEFNTNDALGALDTRRRSAYDERIKQVQALTGEKLENPLPIPRNRIGLEDPISLVYNMFAGDDGAAEIQRMNEHEQKISALRERLGPDDRGQLLTQQQITDKLKAESKQAEKESADIGSRATAGGVVGSIAGSGAASLTQPEMLLTLPLGAPVRAGLLAKMLAETAIGAGTQAIFEPTVQAQRAELGLESGVGPALQNIAVAGVGGGILAGAVGGAGALFKAVSRGGVSTFEKSVGRAATADEKAIVEAVQQDVAMEANTPFVTKDPETYAVKQQNENAAYEAAFAFRPLADDDLVQTEALTKSIIETDRASLTVLRNADLDRIGVDANLMQFKSGGDDFGVTERLRGVSEWQTERAGVSLIYEFEDGKQIIADGHQRLGLARRLASEGKEVELPAITLRAVDGITPEMARARAAFKNIAEGTGTAQDAAKVLRDMGVTPAEMGLPPKSALVRDAEGLVNLDNDVFGMVINDVLSEQNGAIIGRLVQDVRLQPSIANLLVRLKPANAVEADSIVRQALDAGSTREIQTSLFGEEEIAESLYLERARVLDRGLKMLRRNIDTFRTLTERGDDITGAGNVLDQGANASRLDVERTLQQYIAAQANRKGVIGDALTTAAKTAKDTGRYSDAARQFVESISGAAQRGEIDGRAVSRSGIDVEPQYQGDEAPSFQDASSAQQVDDATLDMFGEPVSSAMEDQTRRLAAEIGADAFDRDPELMNMQIPIGEIVDENGVIRSQTVSMKSLLDELESDQNLIEQLNVCGMSGA